MLVAASRGMLDAVPTAVSTARIRSMIETMDEIFILADDGRLLRNSDPAARGTVFAFISLSVSLAVRNT
jgi:hypothetical protein